MLSMCGLENIIAHMHDQLFTFSQPYLQNSNWDCTKWKTTRVGT
jgi:hypothetical protein